MFKITTMTIILIIQFLLIGLCFVILLDLNEIKGNQETMNKKINSLILEEICDCKKKKKSTTEILEEVKKRTDEAIKKSQEQLKLNKQQLERSKKIIDFNKQVLNRIDSGKSPFIDTTRFNINILHPSYIDYMKNE